LKATSAAWTGIADPRRPECAGRSFILGRVLVEPKLTRQIFPPAGGVGFAKKRERARFEAVTASDPGRRAEMRPAHFSIMPAA
jgi:hypothetical protein